MRIGSVVFKGERFTAVFGEREVELFDREIKSYILEGGRLADKAGFEEVEFLPPVPEPQKIICAGLNYRDHAEELIEKKLLDRLPDHPVIFLKPPSSLAGHKQPIAWPKLKEVTRVDFEAELAVVIGKRCKNVKAGEAEKVIFGYSCFNDVTARNLQKEDVQWTRAKSFDSFAPFGPWISTGIDAGSLRIQCILNGRVVQDSSTKNLLFSIPKLIEFISSVMTLEPGDVISTGTPAGVGELKKGDVAQVKIEKIGALENKVV